MSIELTALWFFLTLGTLLGRLLAPPRIWTLKEWQDTYTLPVIRRAVDESRHLD